MQKIGKSFFTLHTDLETNIGSDVISQTLREVALYGYPGEVALCWVW